MPLQVNLPMIHLDVMADLSKPMMPKLAANPIVFLQEVKTELARVTWPSRDDVIKLTTIVIIVSVGIGFYIGGLDWLMTYLTNTLIKR